VSPEVRGQIARELSTVSFTKGFGQTLRGLLSHGIGVHHAGMLPRYRRLVERLTQQGLLPVICGTDTLGVGINVPIRTVLLTSLVKFDGSKMRHLRSREFHQIAGRAGRAGFDTVGFVRVLAPEHEVEAARERARLTAAQEAARDEREAKRAKKKASKKRSGPKEGQITWSRSTFERLRDAAPEALQSHFEMTHSTVLNVLGGAADAGRDPAEHLVHLALHNDDQPLLANPHIRHLADIYTSLLQAGVVEHLSSARAQELGVSRLQLVADLPDDFALNQPLSPFALAAFELLDPDSPTFALDVISIVEAVLEDPRPLLYAQENQAKAAAVASMKAQGMEYDERMAALEEISWPKPLEELLSPAFSVYARSNPWVGDLELSPKSVIREMIENAMTFTELISRYDVGRSEGVILRYLSDAYRMMRQVIPEEIMTEELESMISWLADLIRSVDSSLLDEWEAMMNGEELAQAEGEASAVGLERAFGADESGAIAFTANLHAFRNSVRRTLFHFVELMSRDDVDGLERATAQAADSDGLFAQVAPWTSDDWDHALERYWAEHDWIDINQGARSQALCALEEKISGEDILAVMPFSARDHANQRSRFEALTRAVDEAPAGSLWLATQTITDPEGNMDWRIISLVDLAASDKEKRVVLTVLTVDAR
ncbi:MAG: DUF3516 domain-containing protein, partial [Actinomyces sp.]|nr:DUF3516 domain-containing protein [Actinomyces sp.]